MKLLHNIAASHLLHLYLLLHVVKVFTMKKKHSAQTFLVYVLTERSTILPTALFFLCMIVNTGV